MYMTQGWAYDGHASTAYGITGGCRLKNSIDRPAHAEGEALLTITDAAVLLKKWGFTEDQNETSGLLNTITAANGLPQRSFTESDLRAMVHYAATHPTLPNPSGSLLHQSVQDLGARLPTSDDLTPWKRIDDAARCCAPTGDMSRRSLAAAAIDAGAAQEERTLPASTRKSKPKRLGFKYVQANATARLDQPAHDWIIGQARRINTDKGIYLALLDRALQGHPDVTAIRAAVCLENKLDPASTPPTLNDNGQIVPAQLIESTNTRWQRRVRALRRADVAWANLDPGEAQTRFRAAFHEGRALQFAELGRAVRQPQLCWLFGLRTVQIHRGGEDVLMLTPADVLRIVGPEVLRQRRTTNLALQRPTDPHRST